MFDLGHYITRSVKTRCVPSAVASPADPEDCVHSIEVDPEFGTKQLLEQAAQTFENGSGNGAAGHELEKLHAKIGQLTIERDFFSEEVRRRARRPRPSGSANCLALRARASIARRHPPKTMTIRR